MVHLVVTGHDEKGRSVFVRDDKVEGVDVPGMGQLLVAWSTDQPMSYPDDGTDPAAPGVFPPLGGFRCLVADIAPEDGPATISGDAGGEALSGLADVVEEDDPGMHRTDTTDFGIVLSGTIVLELDDGAEVTLNAGDLVVQNGTRHRWRNPGDTTARICFVVIGAQGR